ncbi:putative fluoride ion transporter CrcB [Clostridia bacterium]|nr:putative fluoride ion transporter CrcB [Clostridia bacterium]
MWTNIFIVGMGGFLGACLRYGISKVISNHSFPFATLISNLLAGFFIGLIIGLSTQSDNLSDRTKLFLTTGFLGGLSTFSTFNLETILLIGEKRYFFAVGNVMLNVCLSLLLCAIGFQVEKTLIK